MPSIPLIIRGDPVGKPVTAGWGAGVPGAGDYKRPGHDRGGGDSCDESRLVTGAALWVFSAADFDGYPADAVTLAAFPARVFRCLLHAVEAGAILFGKLVAERGIGPDIDHLLQDML